MKNILELLENSEKLYPDKTAVSDGKRTITYSRFKQQPWKQAHI